MEYTTPPSYGSTVVNVGGIATDGKILCAGSSNSAKHSEIKGDPENNWPEPGAVEFSWNGTDANGQVVEALVEGSLGERLDRVDVMAEVPKFVKQIVAGAAGTKPYIYQVSNECLERPLLLLISCFSMVPSFPSRLRLAERKAARKVPSSLRPPSSHDFERHCIHQSLISYGVYGAGRDHPCWVKYCNNALWKSPSKYQLNINTKLSVDAQILIVNLQFASLLCWPCCSNSDLELCIFGQGTPPSDLPHRITFSVVAVQKNAQLALMLDHELNGGRNLVSHNHWMQAPVRPGVSGYAADTRLAIHHLDSRLDPLCLLGAGNTDDYTKSTLIVELSPRT